MLKKILIAIAVIVVAFLVVALPPAEFRVAVFSRPTFVPREGVGCTDIKAHEKFNKQIRRAL